MKSKTEIPQRWNDWCDQIAKEAAEKANEWLILAEIVRISDSVCVSDTQKVALIRYLPEAYYDALRAHALDLLESTDNPLRGGNLQYAEVDES